MSHDSAATWQGDSWSISTIVTLPSGGPNCGSSSPCRESYLPSTWQALTMR